MVHRLRAVSVLVALTVAATAWEPTEAGQRRHGLAGKLRLNHVQMLGTHNSYHQPPLVPADGSADYEHLPLSEQLERGVRSLELDVHYRGLPELLVYHGDPVDNSSSCATLTMCLGEIADWSSEHRGHHALLVMIEAKTGFSEFPDAAGEEQRRRALTDLDSSLDTFGVHRTIAPDDVRGDSASVRAALVTNGWPRVGETRGKALFFLLANEAVKRTYLALHPELRGATLFLLDGDTRKPHAAIASYDDPTVRSAEIRGALSATMLVRTRADANLEQHPQRASAALASGAHVVATDFPFDGSVKLSASRCNPVTAPPWCRDRMIEPRKAGAANR